MKAYRITDWKKLYEVTDRSKMAREDTPMESLRKSPLPYIRFAVHGHSLGPTYRKLCKKAWALGAMMEMACFGLFAKLLEIAGDQERQYRGWILDEKQRALNPHQIAELLDIRDSQHVPELLEILADPEIGWLELADLPFSPQLSPTNGGRLGGKSEEPFLNETETNLNESLNETEKSSLTFPDQRGKEGEKGGMQVEQTAAPASALVSDTVSDPSASVSDSAPRQGLRSVEDIKRESANIILQITELRGLHPKNQSDNTTYSDIFEQLRYRMIYETDEPLFEMALKKAKECCRYGDRPIKMFVEAMKKMPFCYVPVRRSTIRGATDKYRGF